MFDSIQVKDFQSVADQKIHLGQRESGGGLTLIVGPSSTGKSAMLRAARTLTVNGPSIPVRVGQSKTLIKAHVNGHTVELERGKSLSTYRLDEAVYQKAGTTVPADVEKFLGLYGDAHFAFQFDVPYLLGEAGSTVTRTLGKLTNAHVLSEAVREGVRRKNEANTLAKARRGDAERAQEALEAYAGLERRTALLRVLQGNLTTARDAERDNGVLTRAVAALESMKAELAGLEAEAKKVPDLTATFAKIRQAIDLTDRLRAMVDDWATNSVLAVRAESEAQEHEAEAQRLTEERLALLHEMGVCPTCGKETT